ncbi:uncharacterized protein LOC100205240 isoform X1 [Hydra vulgaris]|uniref:uncharacterized protein LOC100205240 isoform X1 n=1 Tax=Hydra vulgaris TaxID=6087 RepID=UPI0002B413F5|nr:uncharacterized protein LOC100205240 [Hydra vulgaris]
MLVYVLILATLCHISENIKYNNKWKSFSYAKKGGKCYKGEETTLIVHENGPGVITEQWFAGDDCLSADSTIRYYIDGEDSPSIEANLNMLHGIGLFGDEFINKNKSLNNLEAAWGTKWIGYTAQNGGYYTTMRFPFQHSIRITFIPQRSLYYWYIARGVEHYPLIIGDIQLPSKSRLVLQKTVKSLKHLDYVSLASSRKEGLLFMVTLATSSTNFYHLEGCFRIVVNHKPVSFLSSGTEDMFLSAYYYNKGVFHTDHSGCTYLKSPGSMSAYKFFVDDPVFVYDGFHLVWRSGEPNTLSPNACSPDTEEVCVVEKNNQVFCESNTFYSDIDDTNVVTNITSYVWMYQW